MSSSIDAHPDKVAARPTAQSRIPVWASVLAAVIGGPLSLFIGGVIAVIAAFAVVGITFDEAALTGAAARLAVVGPSVLAQGLGLSLVPIAAALMTRTPLKSALGLGGSRWPIFVLAPVGILALGPVSDGLVRLMKAIAPNLTFDALAQIEAIVEAYPVWVLWPFLALVPGVSEELFFRGLVQRSWGDGLKAITISALSFSAFHMDPHHIAGVIPLGFYLAWLGARTGSLWVCIVTHTVNNTVAIIGSKLAESGDDETLPWWAIPLGLVVAGGVIVVIRRLTPQEKPDDQATTIPDSPQ